MKQTSSLILAGVIGALLSQVPASLKLQAGNYPIAQPLPNAPQEYRVIRIDDNPQAFMIEGLLNNDYRDGYKFIGSVGNVAILKKDVTLLQDK